LSFHGPYEMPTGQTQKPRDRVNDDETSRVGFR
jgi:hypothetical protein